ncbi:cell division protein FtsK, partial [Enterococcus faecium]
DDIRRSQVSQNVGGGMVGAFFYRGTYFLVSQIGSYILAVLMIMIGGFLFSKMSSHELLEHLQHAGEKVQQWLEGSPEKQAAREERKAQKAA